MTDQNSPEHLANDELLQALTREHYSLDQILPNFKRLEALEQECLRRMTQGQAAEAAGFARATRWVSFQERLPTAEEQAENGRWWLVTNGERIDVAMLLRDKTFFGHALQCDDVTHWMPRPKPPAIPNGKEQGHG